MKKQRGVTMVGMMIGAVVVIAVALLAMKVFPDVQDFWAAEKAAKATAMDPANKNASVAEIRRAFDKRIDVDNVKSVRGADVDISKEGSDIVIAFGYTKKIPLYGPVSLAIDFEGSSAK